MTESAPTVAWYVYMVRTRANTLYTGISTDPERRLQEHRDSPKGAKSLRGKGPLSLVWQILVADRSEASSLEARIKHLNKAQKEILVKHGGLPKV